MLKLSANTTTASDVLNGLSALKLGIPSSVTGTMGLYNGSNANIAALRAGVMGSSVTWTLPTGDGTNAQIIQTDGTGNLSFVTPTAASGKVTPYTTVTDTTDVALSACPTQTNVGSSFSMTIPTKGLITWNATCEVIDAIGIATLIFGLRIGSTNYWPTSTRSGSTGYALTGNSIGSGSTDIISSIGVFGGVAASGASSNLGGSQPAGIGIEASGIPTGVQTVQVIAGYTTAASGTLTLKGTVVTTRVYITVEDHT